MSSKAEINLRIGDFKGWFNSAQFLNKRSPKCWSAEFPVGTEKVDLYFVAEVDDDNRLRITICNFSSYEVCLEVSGSFDAFFIKLSTAFRIKASNVGQRILQSLWRNQVQIFDSSVQGDKSTRGHRLC